MTTIFDLDYTLLNIKEFVDKFCTEVLVMPREEFDRHYRQYFKDEGVNFNLEEYLEIWQQEKRISDDQAEEIKVKFKQFIKGIDQYLFPEAEKIIRQFKKRSDKLILVSFGDSGWQKQKVDNLTIKEYFDQIVLEEKDKSKNDFFESLKDSGQKVRIINDNAQESFAMVKKLKDLGLDCRLVLIDGPYSRNVEHQERIYNLNELIQRKKEVTREKLRELELR